MRVFTVNLRSGGGTRVPQLVLEIQRHAPDVAVLTEFRRGLAGDLLQHLLTEAGYAFQVHGEPPVRTNSVLLASREQLTAVTVPAPHYRIVAAEVRGVAILGLYLPLNTAKVKFWDTHLTVAADAFGNRDTILIGDFNTGEAVDRQVPARFFAEDRFTAMLAAGWLDAWRAGNADRSEYSWFSTKGNGFLLDHALLSRSLSPALRGARLVHHTRSTGLSDHSALLLDIAD